MQHFMGEAVAEKIISILQRFKTLYSLETADGRFNSENGKELMAQIDFTHISKEMRELTEEVLLDPTAIPLSQYTGQPIHKIAYYSTNLSIEQQLISELDSTAKVVPYHISGFPLSTGEISDYSVNKGRALKDVCNYLGVDPDHCIAFGDSRNDSEIILAAGLGVAMGNACDALKEVADYITTGVDEDGIARALEYFELI
jgi:hydroxymethylpyrimidine pyrophosphatase-like HAD family hydrolase